MVVKLTHEFLLFMRSGMQRRITSEVYFFAATMYLLRMQADFHSSFPLHASRVHEVCGPSMFGFAAVVCAQVDGDILWVREAWLPDAINPPGLVPYADPKRLLVAQTSDQTDTLSVAEEALRDSAVALVVTELTRPLNLREGRRLQLAAQVGKTIGLCLISEGAGSNAAETRWHCTPVFDPDMPSADSTLQHWKLIKNKKGTFGDWHVRWDATTHRLSVVPPVGKQPGSSDVSG